MCKKGLLETYYGWVIRRDSSASTETTNIPILELYLGCYNAYGHTVRGGEFEKEGDRGRDEELRAGWDTIRWRRLWGRA